MYNNSRLFAKTNIYLSHRNLFIEQTSYTMSYNFLNLDHEELDEHDEEDDDVSYICCAKKHTLIKSIAT